jgi:HPt (histidine-containing phosphotransfer) domain-containing protein/DNA-binding response OmpR family regulator
MSDLPAEGPSGTSTAPQPTRSAPSLRGLALARAVLLSFSLALVAGWWSLDPRLALAVGAAALAGTLNGWVLRGQHHLPSARELLEARRALDSEPPQATESKPTGPARSDTNELLAELAPELSGLSRNVSALLARLADSSLSGEHLDVIEAAQGAQGQLSTLMADVFDLVRIEAGRLKLRRRDFELREEVEEVLEQLCPLAWKRGLDLTAEVDATVPERLFADPRRLRQVIVHLLRATLRATDSGEVFLRASSRGEGSERILRLEIRDTAPRRSSAEFDRLRKRRPSALESLNELDLSLGLALAEGLSGVMGGSFGIGCEGQTGNGLWLEVPVEVPEGAGSGAAREDLDLVGRRMLVIEARAASRESLVAAGNRLGLRVDAAADELDATGQLRAAFEAGDPIELILLDDGMGGGAGREIVQRITSSARWSRPLSLLLTSGGAPENPAQLVRMGVDAWVPKPLRLKRLEEGIRHVLNRSAESASKSEAGTMALVPRAPGNPLERENAPEPSDRRDPSPVRVLLLEPDASLARVQVALLRRLGCRVVWQDEARGFLRQYQDAVFDLLLADRGALLTLDGDEVAALSEARDGAQDVLISWENRGEGPGGAGPPGTGGSSAELGESVHSAVNAPRARCADLDLEKPNNPLAVRVLLSNLLGDAISPSSNSPTSLDSLPRPLPVNENASPIDPDVIQSLKDLGGEDEPELFRELVGMFLRDTPPRLEALGRALESGDAHELERVAHAMKSSCGNLGAVVMAELCYQLEMVGREGALDSAQSLVQRSNDEFRRVIEALESELA